MIEELKLAVLVDDTKNPINPEFKAKHGLSFYIEADIGNEKIKVLMDTGPSSKIILHNADAMDVDLRKINTIFLSHGHYDHVGGLIGVLKSLDEPKVVIAHPKAFDPKFGYRPYLKYLGAPFQLSEIKAAGGALILAKNPVKIADNMMSSGEIERYTAFEKIKEFWKIDDDLFIEDTMLDDQSLIVNIRNKGLAVVAGCAHSGIINTVRQAQRVTGISKVYAVIGGFHLKNADNEKIKQTIEELLIFKPNIIAPCHCTGSKTVKRLSEVFDVRCKPLRVGEILELK